MTIRSRRSLRGAAQTRTRNPISSHPAGASSSPQGQLTSTLGGTDVQRRARPANAFARSAFPILSRLPLRWINPTLGGVAWNTLTWDSVVWDSVAWDNFDWASVAWDES